MLAAKFALQVWLRRFWPVIAIFLIAQTVLRVALAVKAGRTFVDTPWDVVRPFAIGLWFDLAVLLVALLPGTIYWALLPAKWRGGRADRLATFSGFVLVAFIIGFTVIGEVLFWNEFTSRFNFIAVDYLVYTREVAGNIWESYPVGKLVAGLAFAALLIAWLLRRSLRAEPDTLSYAGRAGIVAALAAAAFVVNDTPKYGWTEVSSNAYANELAENGYYSLIRAFFRNEIDYRRFYIVETEKRVNDRIRELVSAPNAHFVTDQPGDVTRDIIQSGAPLRKNVVLVTIESLSASFMAHFGNANALTPNLDALADQSAFFTHMLATGTRTVRGLEAVTLSVPPTPGQSILRRPGNEKLFTIGSVLRDRGYDTTFLYGGNGYFDNMNAFFGGNGYKIVDQKQMAPSEITFSNAWGVSDEDLFARALKEADASVAAGHRFFQHVMTVSNHRPFTYPAGRITPPHQTGAANLADRTLTRYVEQTREGGVRYTDYAIGKFLEQARTRPWFKDTLFVFVADHTASSAGRIEVDPNAYHIPALFYAPDFVTPRRIDRLVSQIDIAPTILGALRLSYRSRFIGQDQFGDEGPARAFISNYQKVALVRGDEIALLGPRRDVRGYAQGMPVGEDQLDKSLLFDAITYYQHASGWQTRFAGTTSIPQGGPGD